MAKVRKRLTKHQVDITPVDNEYVSEAAMIADQVNQTAGYLYFDGEFYYEYLGTTNSIIEDYRLISAAGGIEWLTVTADLTAEQDKGYISDKTGSRLLITLPSSGIEFTVRVAGLGLSGWRVVPPVGGSIAWIDVENIVQLDSIMTYDAIELLCVNPGQYIVISSIGNIEFTN